MSKAIKIIFNVPESYQLDSFQNSTLQSLSHGQAMSIAVHLSQPSNIDADNEQSIRTWLTSVFESVVAHGGEVEVQIGPSSGHDS